MSIDPNVVYGLFRFSAKNGPTWYINRRMSGDLVAGLLVGIHAMYSRINIPTILNYDVTIYPANKNYNNEEEEDEDTADEDEYDYYGYYDDYYKNYGHYDDDDPNKDVNIVTVVDGYGNTDNLNTYYQAIDSYFWNLLNTNGDWEELNYQHDNINYRDLYYWYIYYNDGNDQTYKLYAFNTLEFIQGFITICRAFQVDYIDYVQGNPFRYNEGNNNPTFYLIEV